MTDAALQGGLVDEVVVVELAAVRPNDLDAMRRREVVEHAVQVHNGVLVEVRDHYVIPDWDHVKQAEICQRVAGCLAGGGGAWGARADEGLVALAAVDAQPVGGDPGVVALDLLNVSAPWRRLTLRQRDRRPGILTRGPVNEILAALVQTGLTCAAIVGVSISSAPRGDTRPATASARVALGARRIIQPGSRFREVASARMARICARHAPHLLGPPLQACRDACESRYIH